MQWRIVSEMGREVKDKTVQAGRPTASLG